jgi:hypothetical protein
MTSLYTLYEVTCFENEEDPAAAEKAAADQATKEKTFTQDQVDQMIVKRNKALQEKYQSLETSMEDLLKQQNLSREARAQLEVDLENVQSQMRTKEQQIEFEKKKAQSQYETNLQSATQERDHYRELFETTTTHREITDAAIAAKGYNNDDFINWLAPRAKVVDELDIEGQKTGRKVTQIKWDVKDPETGAVTQVEKRPAEVIQMMKEDPSGRWGNLFEPNVAKGIGAGTAAAQAGGSGKIDVSKLSMEEYMKLREDPEFKARIGLSQ